VDLGVAQGDTLSCILFNLFIDDLLRQVYATCPGLTLSETTKLVALMFADDFVGLASTPERLQGMIDAVFAFCSRWRLRANIESGKSTVLVFHPNGCTEEQLPLAPAAAAGAGRAAVGATAAEGTDQQQPTPMARALQEAADLVQAALAQAPSSGQWMWGTQQLPKMLIISIWA
jgi:hypothetical protein